MDRREELLKHAAGKTDKVVVEHFVDRIVFLENECIRLEAILKECQKDGAVKKEFAYSKEYRSTVAQYNSAIRTYNHLCGGTEEIEEESPLRAWAKANGKK